MYAVIKAGGKQQKVKAGDVIEIELTRGGEHGDSVTFAPLLVVDDEGKAHVGKDLAKAKVKAKLVGEQKGDKVKVFKYRPKSGYSRRQGHRQMYTLVEIEDVSLGGAASRARASKETTAASKEAPDVEISSSEATASEPDGGGAPTESHPGEQSEDGSAAR
jgi:large subunit ribosomal protein L21